MPFLIMNEVYPGKVLQPNGSPVSNAMPLFDTQVHIRMHGRQTREDYASTTCHQIMCVTTM